MDVVEDSWEALQKAADDRDTWKLRVRRIKDLARATTKSAKRREAATATHQLQSQRFTFVPQPSSKPKHRVTQATVNAFFEPRKRLYCKPIGWKPELAAYFKPRGRATATNTTNTNNTEAAAAATGTSTTTTTTTSTTPPRRQTIWARHGRQRFRRHRQNADTNTNANTNANSTTINETPPPILTKTTTTTTITTKNNNSEYRTDPLPSPSSSYLNETDPEHSTHTLDDSHITLTDSDVLLITPIDDSDTSTDSDFDFDLNSPPLSPILTVYNNE